VCEYWPERIDARDGQHSDVVTNEFLNVIPCAAISRSTFGMSPSVSKRWSSERIRTMFGGDPTAPASRGEPLAIPASAATATAIAMVRRARTSRR
jgi:hypothetical protein